ncbi:MAG TPA: hypothetical protein VHS80_02065 [Chthoniobacterales bacterium]|jgi:hypothetical protein|nr:hypothetical protein [Chthoniobacterales bacterium]
MSDIEDYPGPSRNHPEKEGQDDEIRADEEMVKPPARPGPKKEESSPAKAKNRGDSEK